MLIRRNASVGRAIRSAPGAGSGVDPDAAGADAPDMVTETELGRERVRGGGDVAMDGYRCNCGPAPAFAVDEPLPDLSTLVWNAAVSGSGMLGPVDDRGRKGSAFGAVWRPVRLGRRRELDHRASNWSGEAGGEGSCRERVSAYSSASPSSGTGSMPRPMRVTDGA